MVWLTLDQIEAVADLREGRGGDRPHSLDGCWPENRDARPIKSRLYKSQITQKLAF